MQRKMVSEAGKKTTIENIICDFQDGLYRFAYFRTGSAADAQDIVQSVFINMYSTGQYAQVDKLKAYLYKSVANACSNFHRQKRTTVNEAILDNKDSGVSTATPLMLKEQYKTMLSLLQKIPPDQAEVIRMRLTDELHFKEIAQLLEEPETTVKSKFKYGMDKLKAIVKSKNYYHEMF